MERRFLVDENGKKSGVIISLKEYKLYKKLLEKREMGEDVKADDKAKVSFAKNPECCTIEELERRLEHIISNPDYY